MIIDSSVIMAILLAEPEAELFIRTIGLAERRYMSAASWVELGAVAGHNGDDNVSAAMQQIVDRLRIEIVPVTGAQAKIGHQAYLTYGKNRHEARLNFGDCFSYALAKETALPLLFKDNDFTHTDIVSAL